MSHPNWLCIKELKLTFGEIMKLTIVLSIMFSVVSAFSESPLVPETLLETQGANNNGSVCEYTVMHMLHWEGQTAIFINTDTGNFRVELDTESLSKGNFKSPYDGVSMQLKDNVLNVVVPAAEWNDAPKSVYLVLEDRDILKPVSVVAAQGIEFLDCKF